MAMDHLLEGLFDELEKISVSLHMSSFMQSRAGRRPIRAHNLLSKPHPFKTPPNEKTLSEEGEREGSKDYESETGPGLSEEPQGGR